MKIFIKVTIVLGISTLFLSTAFSKANIWGSIPFQKGQDICAYNDAYGQSRTQYMQKMVGLAKSLMRSGAYGSEALNMLRTFNNLYDQNKALAIRGNYLDVTLESTLKSFLSSYYRNLRPESTNIVFRNLKSNYTGEKGDLDYMAYASYSFAPDCTSNIVVTLHLVDSEGTVSKSYIATGPIETVMSIIASRMFEDFQRTQFPSSVRVGNQTIRLLGALNGNIGIVKNDPRKAERICKKYFNGRLPNQHELEVLNGKGPWSGGISLDRRVWALPYGMVYHPGLQNPSPVRYPHHVNEKNLSYFCIN